MLNLSGNIAHNLEYDMNKSTIKTDDAIELAYAFATYKSVRVCDLDTVTDCRLAETATRILRKTQEEVGIYLVETDRLLATEARMVRYAKALSSRA